MHGRCQEEFTTTGRSSREGRRAPHAAWARLAPEHRDCSAVAPSYLIVLLNYSGSLPCCATVNWAREFVSVSLCVQDREDRERDATTAGGLLESRAIATGMN